MGEVTLHVERTAGVGWPHRSLDVDELLRDGWRPRPFRQFILKIHGRCNLACDYCYVYRSADQGWRDQPPQMSRATVSRAAERIAQHARVHELPSVQVVLHGGEPLLAGREHLDFACATLRAALLDDVGLDLYTQTNATLVDSAILEVFLRHDVRVGVSLDGGPAAQDRHRRRGRGEGSHTDVARGLSLLRSPRYRRLFAGILCVVDLRSDPTATYEHLVGHEPPAVDFLLPHANWSDPPGDVAGQPAPYGHWLVAAFDRWYDAPERETSVRLFDEIIRGVVGRPSRVESIGLAPAVDVVVETDGAIEHIDALKTTYHGAARTGLHVRDDPFDAALLLPHAAARQIGRAALADTCQRCDIHRVCGGGFYPHRYRRRSGFRNPSVYCEDLALLIRHVLSRVRHDLAPLRGSPARDEGPHRPS